MSDKSSKTPIRQCENEATFDAIESSLVSLWDVVNDLSSIRPPKQEYYRVTIFGSSRMRPGDPIYQDVKQLASDLAGMGCDIVTGGGPGLMQAANEGEKEGDVKDRTRSFGLPIQLPFEEGANPFVEKMFMHKTFFTRLHHFVRLSSAFVVVRGGIGTSLEAFMIWQLLQVRHITDIPLVFVGDMWQQLQKWAEESMVQREVPLASPEDIAIPHCVATPEEACQVIAADLAEWRETHGREG